MKRITWGIVVGGAAAAAFVGSATANATGDTWTPNYDIDNAQLFVGSGPAYTAAWELPASFTSGTGADATTLTGTDYLTASPGGLNDEFVTNDGVIYDQDQLGGGFTNLYYDMGGPGNNVVDYMKTPFGSYDISSMASLFTPGDFEKDFSTAATVGQNIVVADGAEGRIGAALGLSSPGEFTGGLTEDATITPMLTKDSSLVWEAPASYTGGVAGDQETLTGNLYVTSPTNVEFVDNSGDVFAQNELGSGLFVVNNLYYDPVNGPAQDYLETTFGNIDISSLASWFAPADVSDLTAASPVADLADAGLYSALDMGMLNLIP